MSVIIPTRNRLGYLKEAILSSESQTYPAIEIVVVDDASTDQTADWLEANQSRVRSITSPEQVERSVARNMGMQLSTGEFVLFLDDDDRLLPRAIERLIKPLIRRKDLVGAIGARIVFDDAGNRRRIYHPRIPARLTLWPAVMASWVAPSGQCLFRRTSLENVGGWSPDFPPSEDQDLLLRLGKEGPFSMVGGTVLEQRSHASRSALRAGVEERLRAEFTSNLSFPERELAERMYSLRDLRLRAEALRGEGRMREAMKAHYRALALRPLSVGTLLLPPEILGLINLTAQTLVGHRAASKIRGAKRAIRKWRGKEVIETGRSIEPAMAPDSSHD